MCTLSVAYYPKTQIPIRVVANRDENPERPSQPWLKREFSSKDKDNLFLDGIKNSENITIFSPLDVLGGTWIGCNSAGWFCAITNWDIEINARKNNSLRSRGLLVIDLLRHYTNRGIIEYTKKIKPKDYKPFNIIIGSVRFLYGKSILYNISNNHKYVNIKELSAGFHISTGQGFNQYNFERDRFIRQEMIHEFKDLSQPIDREILSNVMKTHHAGFNDEKSVCQHDDTHKWETRSQSMLDCNLLKAELWHADGHPCKVKDWYNESFSYSG